MTGRPRLRPLIADVETLADLERLGAAQCGEDELMRFFSASKTRLMKLMRQPNARRTYETAKARGLLALREAQLKMAATSVPMAVLLGKTYLGQNERREDDDQASNTAAGAGERLRAKLAAIVAAAEHSENRGGA